MADETTQRILDLADQIEVEHPRKAKDLRDVAHNVRCRDCRKEIAEISLLADTFREDVVSISNELYGSPHPDVAGTADDFEPPSAELPA